MDMVDSALKRPDVALSKRGTFGLSSIRLRAVRRFFLTQNPGRAGPVSFNIHWWSGEEAPEKILSFCGPLP